MSVQASIRAARPTDQKQLANLIHFESNVHRHLDWRQPLAWINDQPFLVAESGDQIYAALACPPDPPAVAWIRLFAVASGYSLEESWTELWSRAKSRVSNFDGCKWVSSIAIWGWFAKLLRSSGFQETDRVVMLHWDRGDPFPGPPNHRVLIRSMSLDDIPDVQHIDHASFVPAWQNSRRAIELAYSQAAIASLVEVDGLPVAYQISSSTPMGGHIARLAVLPEFQGQGIGFSLIYDTLDQFERQGAQRVSVNTQKNNQASLALYKKAHFRLSGEEFPYFQFRLD